MRLKMKVFILFILVICLAAENIAGSEEGRRGSKVFLNFLFKKVFYNLQNISSLQNCIKFITQPCNKDMGHKALFMKWYVRT
jgi:hypothetical protein